MPFVREGLELGESVVVALRSENTALLEGELGEDAEAVRFVDMATLGSNPARIIGAWRDYVAVSQSSGVRGIGEPAWPGRTEAELTECDHHESLLNFAFADADGFTLLCPYDESRLDDATLEAARRNHPVVAEAGARAFSGSYLEPASAPDPLLAPLAPPGVEPQRVGFVLSELVKVRAFVRELAAGVGLDASRATDLALAVSELAANSVRHGGGSGEARGWAEGGWIYFEVADAGRLSDPLLGRIRPTPQQDSGRGLWLVHQLCDLVHLRSGPDGTVARVCMRTL